jgi:hypothetical protein
MPFNTSAQTNQIVPFSERQIRRLARHLDPYGRVVLACEIELAGGYVAAPTITASPDVNASDGAMMLVAAE